MANLQTLERLHLDDIVEAAEVCISRFDALWVSRFQFRARCETRHILGLRQAFGVGSNMFKLRMSRKVGVAFAYASAR